MASYPAGEEAKTCYHHEPWHYRYVGRQLAADVRASGRTLREYLWSRAAAERRAIAEARSAAVRTRWRALWAERG